jgi:hypothetical protein
MYKTSSLTTTFASQKKKQTTAKPFHHNYSLLNTGIENPANPACNLGANRKILL